MGVLASLGSFRRYAPPAITHATNIEQARCGIEFLQAITQRLRYASEATRCASSCFLVASTHFVRGASLRFVAVSRLDAKSE